MKNKSKVEKVRTISYTKMLCISLYILSGICLMVYTTETMSTSRASAEGNDSSTSSSDDTDLGYGINTANASVTVGTACTFSASVTNPHTSTIENGLSSDNIGTTILNTTCNDSGGYAVYAIGYTNEEYGNTSLTYSSLDSTPENPITNSNYDIPTGTATSGDTSNWAMKLDTVSGTTTATIEADTNGSFSNYHIIPEDYTKVATLNTVTDNATASPSTGSSISTTYSAYISPTQAPGTYTGKVKYTLVHPSIAPKPEKPKTINDLTYMQDFGTISEEDLASVKASMLVEVTYTLKDQRDEQNYTVAKLKDGKIWTTKNLNLAGGTEITSELSDVPENYTLPTANGFQEGNKLPSSSASGFDVDNMAYVYNTGNKTSNCSDPGCYSYYSWTTATAGSIVSATEGDVDAEYSICPKGWRLPNSRSRYSSDYELSDYQILVTSYGGDDFYNQASFDTVADFIPAGVYYSDSFIDGNQYGNYWSATSNGSGAYDLMFNSRAASSQHSYGGRKPGRSVRCLVR